MEIPLPSDAFLLPNSDIGKPVIINSVGGLFKNEKGIVLYGPYSYFFCLIKKKVSDKEFIWIAPKKLKEQPTQEDLKNETPGRRYKWGNAAPQWYVQIESTGRCFNFTEPEITF